MDPTARPTDEPLLCSGGCGFFGSADTSGFCSVCWKSRQSALQAATAATPAPAASQQPPPEPPAQATPAEQPDEAPQPAEEAAAPAAGAAAPDEPEKPVQENRGRCFCCRKKVGLLGFECRCGYVFCSGHRHAIDHNCAFDYAAMDKANLAKANNKVVAAKVDKL